ncbi:MAG: TIGR02265 family protein [Polyangiales bacterium]
MGAIFEAAAAHCDIGERLEVVRDDQRVRGVWFAMLRDEMFRRGLHGAFERDVGLHESVTFKMYPVADYLRRLVCAGALVASPENVHDGMRELHRSSVRYFARSVLGRAIVSLVRPTPLQFLKQVERSRSLMATFGEQRVTALGERSIRVHHVDDPVYIESAQVGGLLSTLEVCGFEAHVQVDMRSPFDGILTVEW